jgi:hypothetical protein
MLTSGLCGARRGHAGAPASDVHITDEAELDAASTDGSMTLTTTWTFTIVVELISTTTTMNVFFNLL